MAFFFFLKETAMEMKPRRPSSLLCFLLLSNFGTCPKGMDVSPHFILFVCLFCLGRTTRHVGS